METDFKKILREIGLGYTLSSYELDACDEKIAAFGEGRDINPAVYDNYYKVYGKMNAYKDLIIRISGCESFEVDEVAKIWREAR